MMFAQWPEFSRWLEAARLHALDCCSPGTALADVDAAFAFDDPSWETEFENGASPAEAVEDCIDDILDGEDCRDV